MKSNYILFVYTFNNRYCHKEVFWPLFISSICIQVQVLHWHVGSVSVPLCLCVYVLCMWEETDLLRLGEDFRAHLY